MKRMSYILLAMLFVFGSVVMCEADSITTSATGSLFGDNYSYTFVITDDNSAATPDPTLFHATLTNTSTGGSDSSITYDPLIDQFAFNLNAALSSDFSILNIVPSDWLIDFSGGGVLFDYVGDEQPSVPDHRLHAGQSLTFDFDFIPSFLPADPFEVWTGTDESLGSGFGGGADISGQVAVSFQRLGGVILDASDHLASNWEAGGEGEDIPEPATMLLLGSGFIVLAVSGKKKFKKRNG